MNWEAIGAVGEILGAVAVVATIVYLARQVRDNSRQVKLNSSHSFAALVQDAYGSVYTNEQTLRAWLTGTRNPTILNEDDLQLYFRLMDRQFNNTLPLMNHYKEGAMSREEFEHYKEAYLAMTSTEGGKVWMSTEGNYFVLTIEKLRDA